MHFFGVFLDQNLVYNKIVLGCLGIGLEIEDYTFINEVHIFLSTQYKNTSHCYNLSCHIIIIFSTDFLASSDKCLLNHL